MTLAGIVTPGSLAGAVRYYPALAGTAAGLSSAVGLVLGGAFTIVSGSLYTGSIRPVVVLVCLACLAAAGSFLLARRAVHS